MDESLILAQTELYRVRVLPPEEWQGKDEELAHYPYMPDPHLAVLIVVEEKATGKIVASWMALNTIHLEGLYVVPEQRNQQTTIQRLLLGGMLATLRTLAIPHALTLTENPDIIALARKAGFTVVDGTLLRLDLETS